MIEPIRVWEEEAEDHREAGRGADLQDEFDGQQADDAEGDGAGGEEDAEEVEEARPDDGDLGRQGMGVDDGGDRVGGVVEAVHELEAERDDQRHEQQQVGQPGRGPGAGGVDVRPDRVADVPETEDQHREEGGPRPPVDAAREVRPRDGRRRRRACEDGAAHGRAPARCNRPCHRRTP
jgi:hypothetical protein